MLFGRHPTLSGKTVALFHVSSDSVACALVTFHDREGSIVPEILGETRERFKMDSDMTFERFLECMTISLREAGKRIINLHLKAPDHISVILGAPWYAAQVRSVRKEQSGELPVSKRMISDLIAEEIRKFTAEEVARYEGGGEKVTMIEQELVRVSLNGYETDDPHGKRARVIELSLMLSLSPALVTEKITQVVAEVFHRHEIFFHSFLYASSIVSRDLFALHEQFLLVDVSGEVTDIACVKNGALSHLLSFPVGHSLLLRSVASKLSLSLDEARSLIALEASGKLEPKARERLLIPLESARTTWVRSLEAALFELASGDFLLPHTVICISLPEVAPLFVSAIESDALKGTNATEQPFSVALLGSGSLAPFVTAKSAISDRLLIDALFLSRKEGARKAS
jgi:hypothetical protein